MKRKLLFLACVAPLLISCGPSFNRLDYQFESNPVSSSTKVKGTLGDFDLIAPDNHGEVFETPTFSWSASENAISYTLEICEFESFVSNNESVIYIKQSNISATTFGLSSPLKTKNIDYYWRVTAVNNNNSNAVGKTKVSDTRVFTYKSQNVDEIPISVGEEGDWALHKDGSYADIDIDKNNFFGEGDPNSLRISFDQEHTKQGIEESDGWIVVTKPIEKDFYGTDALYLNVYYTGDDADVLVRLIDADGEYWYSPIQISRNAKQTVLIKYTDFILRTKDTTVQNEEFNSEHIQNLEIVFEHSFGDGCFFAGNIRAVNFDNYSDRFIEKVNFSNYPVDKWTYESYNFKKTINGEGNELVLEYSTTAGFNGNEKGIGSYGYGLAKVPLECYFAGGNAMKIKIKFSGYRSNVKGLIRVYEEDKDRWFYEQPFSQLTENEFSEFTIPFAAFAKNEISGDGNRQFYYILNLQLGVSGVYGSGSITFKDIEIVQLPKVSTNPIKVGEDGIIENFDSYADRTETYLKWESSVENKDEGIFLNSINKYAKANNVNAGQFNYKSDMGMATYDAYTDVSYEGGNAISISIKDASVKKSGTPGLDHIKEEDVSPTLVMQVVLVDGRWYRYTINKAPRKWTEYVISFKDFELFDGYENPSISFTSENVVNFAFGLQYFYYDVSGKPFPLYTESNPVYIDDIKFVKADSSKITKLEQELHPVSGVTMIDEFEYSSQEELDAHWFGLNGLEYEKITLSDDVSSEGGSHSMKLDYKGGSSPSYAVYPAFGEDVQAKALLVDIKGDGAATIYINFYINVGTSLKQYRHTITSAASGWNRYVIGLDDTIFPPMTSTDQALDINSVRSIQRITFGIVNSSSQELSSIYIDNLGVSSAVKSFTTHTVTPIA